MPTFDVDYTVPVTSRHATGHRSTVLTSHRARLVCKNVPKRVPTIIKAPTFGIHHIVPVTNTLSSTVSISHKAGLVCGNVPKRVPTISRRLPIAYITLVLSPISCRLQSQYLIRQGSSVEMSPSVPLLSARRLPLAYICRLQSHISQGKTRM